VAKQKLKTAAADYPIPSNREEADEFIREIGSLMRDRELIQIALVANFAALKAEYEAKAKPINQQLQDRQAGLQTWCETNRAELLRDGGKTAKFGNGEVSWRNRPASVTLRGVDAIIAYCKDKLNWLFLRINIEVSKEMMLANQDLARKIPGVTIASAGEDFIITPINAPLQEVKSDAR
jgi:phage host-nuclease inhibitor protein Gam